MDVDAIGLLRSMQLIRAFEDALMRRPDHGFQLLSAGQEAVAVGVCAALTADDQLLTSGRSIGPALARGLDPGAVMAELLGRVSGPNGGRGGRGHLADPDAGFFGAHSVVGGNLAIAAGVAMAVQLSGRPGVAVCIFGDGACGSGALHETLNIAALWKLPLILVCDNNGLSIATPQAAALAPSCLADLAAPFRIPASTIDGMDVLAVRDAVRAAAQRARLGEGPSFVECLSGRFSTHSTSTRETRAPNELAALKARCPIRRLAAHLEALGGLTADARSKLEGEVADSVAAADAFADAAPYPNPDELLHDVV